jgi:hypothetical protein
MPQTNTSRDAAGGLPIHGFSRCHEGIRAHLRSLAELARQTGATAQTRDIARHALQSFRGAMYDHHAEEEKELFPAVLAASNAAEYGALRALAEWLTADHRGIETLWTAIEPGLEQLALGESVQLDTAAVTDLVTRYEAHARQEEEQFLPLAETILARKDPSMAALGLSLHMRHQLRAARMARDVPDRAAPG